MAINNTGYEHVVLNDQGVPEIAGTVCGDDTLFLVVRDGVSAGHLALQLRTASGSAG